LAETLIKPQERSGRAKSAPPAPGYTEVTRKTWRKSAYTKKEREEYLNSLALHGDHFFLFDKYLTDECPVKEINGHVWKDWESIASIDWPAYLNAVAKEKADKKCPPYLVVEGFLLLATPESQALFDAVIHVKLSKEECWHRRRHRAQSMSHLPPGFATEEEPDRNYEVLETYVKSDADKDAILAEAAQRYPEEGDLAWLRMYFEEVVWPASELQSAEVTQLGSRDIPVKELDAQIPKGPKAWKLENFPPCVTFVHEHGGVRPTKKISMNTPYI